MEKTYPDMGKGWADRLKAVYACNFSYDGDNGHEDAHEAVLKYSKPNDLGSPISNWPYRLIDWNTTNSH